MNLIQGNELSLKMILKENIMSSWLSINDSREIIFPGQGIKKDFEQCQFFHAIK